MLGAWDCAGVSSLGLWVKLEEALHLLQLPILNLMEKGLSKVETHLAQACSASEHGLTYLMVLSFVWCDMG